MMTYGDVKQLIARESGRNECFKECNDALVSGELKQVHFVPGRMTVRDALATFRVRWNTTSTAGVPICGFEQTLESLAARAAEDIVLVYGFVSNARAFSVFVAESDRSAVGCIRVTGRLRGSDRE